MKPTMKVVSGEKGRKSAAAKEKEKVVVVDDEDVVDKKTASREESVGRPRPVSPNRHSPLIFIEGATLLILSFFLSFYF